MAKYTYKKISAKLAGKAVKAVKAVKAADDVSPEDVNELQAISEDIRSLGRRTNLQAYELGGYLARAKAILPERELGAWVKAICKFTPKTARNYIAVYENLSVYKERLVATATSPTMLFVLAYAEEQKVEEVLAALEAGEELTVAQVKQMVGVSTAKKTAPVPDSLNMGGLAGLRKVADLKIEQDAARFLGLTTSILKKVEKALEPLSRNRAVRKGALCDAVTYDCRHAHDLINSLAAPLRPDVTPHLNWRPEKLPDGTSWRKVQALLHRMGGAEDWPDRSSFVPWLQNEVVPLLRFVVHGEPLAGDTEEDARSDVAMEIKQEVDDRSLAYDQMPPPERDQIDRALETVSSDGRDEPRTKMVFEATPFKRQLKRLAA